MMDSVALKLAREVLGSFRAFEPEVRQVISNTNFVLIRDLAELVVKRSESMRSPPAHPGDEAKP